MFIHCITYVLKNIIILFCLGESESKLATSDVLASAIHTTSSSSSNNAASHTASVSQTVNEYMTGTIKVKLTITATSTIIIIIILPQTNIFQLLIVFEITLQGFNY